MGPCTVKRIAIRTNFHSTLAVLASKARLTPRDDISGVVYRHLGPPPSDLVDKSLEGSCLLAVYEEASFYRTAFPDLKIWSKIEKDEDLFVIEVNLHYETPFCGDFLPEIMKVCDKLKFLAFVPFGEGHRVLYCNFEKGAP